VEFVVVRMRERSKSDYDHIQNERYLAITTITRSGYLFSVEMMKQMTNPRELLMSSPLKTCHTLPTAASSADVHG